MHSVDPGRYLHSTLWEIIHQLTRALVGLNLTIGKSDGTTDLVSGETGKVLRQVGDDDSPIEQTTKSHRARVSCLGWSVSHSRPLAKTLKVKGTLGDYSTQEWIDGKPILDNPPPDPSGLSAPGASTALVSLPDQLANLDFESVLPRLSTIPGNSKAAGRLEIFSTQSAVDTFFKSSQHAGSMATDIIITGHEHGTARITINDTLVNDYIGSSDGGFARGTGVPIMHSTHPLSTHHALLRAYFEDSIQEDSEVPLADDRGRLFQSLSLDLFQLPSTISGSPHAHLIISKTAQLRDIFVYLQQSVTHLEQEWKTHTDLPSRFMRNINETLAEKNEGTLDQNMYVLAMMGQFNPTMTEWLADELAERVGHFRR